MKIRFGEFPENHHFLQVVRPFVEWTFKFIGWQLIVSTLQFAQERTGSRTLLYVLWLSYLLILGFIGAFVDWVLSFERERKFSGKMLADIVAAEIKSDGAGEAGGNSKKLFRKLRRQVRALFVVLISVLLTVLLVGAANMATEKIIGSLVEFQQKSAPKTE